MLCASMTCVLAVGLELVGINGADENAVLGYAVVRR